MSYNYAIVMAGRVHQLFDEKPLVPEAIRVISVSQSPDVAEGWIVGDDDSVSAPVEPAPEPEPVPTITRAQAKIQLRRAGLRDQVEALIAKADPEVQDWYAEAGFWMRDNANVVAMAKQLKLKASDVDDLFRAAALIEA